MKVRTSSYPLAAVIGDWSIIRRHAPKRMAAPSRLRDMAMRPLAASSFFFIQAESSDGMVTLSSMSRSPA